jgi:hypothetical protein
MHAIRWRSSAATAGARSTAGGDRGRVVLAGEISLYAAISSLEWVSSHHRNR